jgi:pilus assembly protein CpaB
MNRNRLLMIGVVALALGLFVSSAVYSKLGAKNQAAPLPGVDVLVAAKDLAVGSKITSEDIKFAHSPQGSVPASAMRQKTDALERGVVLPISAGEFILPSKIAADKAGAGLPALIPTGMRAVSVRVNEVVSVAGFVLPGTRVDVLLTGNPSGSNDQQTTTVLENVAVLASGQKLERNSAGDPENTAVITLLVSPDDAQKLTLASSQGKVQLSLRNPLDTKQQDLGIVSTNSLYRGSAPIRPATTTIAAAHPRPKTTTISPAPPSVYSVEVIKGDKREETKF